MQSQQNHNSEESLEDLDLDLGDDYDIDMDALNAMDGFDGGQNYCMPMMPVNPMNKQIFCGDIDIRIARDGTWYHEGSPFTRKELVCLFSSVLERDDKGDFWLCTPGERARIVVDDAPFLGVELFHSQTGRDQVLSVRTNVDEIITIGPKNPLRVETDPDSQEPSPYIKVRDGDGDYAIEALLSRNVFYELVARGVEEIRNGEAFYGVWSQNEFFPLGKLDTEET